ncbi:hypothetical protein BU26DRAFT_219889 [Trematosphaeria pertusa]|uniref:Uncharacterized protein n=1 Tax=Trematosphaeria pertusa TaxID=390896 RepID=A0A6A6IVR7_9PLEO|nr:uncharacterized protein BU26DRAFT_219889 [Trematosphaeria pertusa]KAF2253293.1 hypothetical protein BU26DRAFT_219889 [Trematosphaeria pertusa]
MSAGSHFARLGAFRGVVRSYIACIISLDLILCGASPIACGISHLQDITSWKKFPAFAYTCACSENGTLLGVIDEPRSRRACYTMKKKAGRFDMAVKGQYSQSAISGGINLGHTQAGCPSNPPGQGREGNQSIQPRGAPNLPGRFPLLPDLCLQAPSGDTRSRTDSQAGQGVPRGINPTRIIKLFCATGRSLGARLDKGSRPRNVGLVVGHASAVGLQLPSSRRPKVVRYAGEWANVGDG